MNKKLLVTAVVLALGLSSTTWADDTVSSDNGGTFVFLGSAAVTVSDSGNGNDLSDNSTSTNSTSNSSTDNSNNSTNNSASDSSDNSTNDANNGNNNGTQVSESGTGNDLRSGTHTATKLTLNHITNPTTRTP